MTNEQRIKEYAVMLHEGKVTNKKDALLSLGYAETTARNPQSIEKTETFIAVSEQIGMMTAGHVAKLSDILDKRDFSDMDTKDVVDAYAKLAGTFVKLAPKEQRDNNLKAVYARVINVDSAKDTDSHT